jgi:ribonucleoside-diphosphate reductase alpha chain
MGDEIPLTENAKRILESRYLLKDLDGEILETPDQMFWRVAKNVARSNALYERSSDPEHMASLYHEAMSSLEFLPNSPTLMNAGTEIQQLSACFVIPIEDSIEGIYDAVKFSALIQQSGGGTGFSFSHLRPSGDTVRSTGGVASGPVSFMRVFDSATEAIKQGGRRRGASMGVLSVDHPDIEAFIQAKRDPQSLTNFNISVAVTDVFMRKAERGESYSLINPHTGRAREERSASYIMDLMAENAWRTGDPGLIFIDEVNRRHPAPALGRIEATNPCGEVPLLPYEACNLGSINLDRIMVKRDGSFQLDWERFKGLIHLGVRFLDDAIDASKFPLSKIDEAVKANRKIGLGIMGFADCLIKMGVTYGTDESVTVAREITSFMARQAEECSRQLAEERGSFPNIGLSLHSPPRRNLTLLSMAPTGTISMIAGCSSGIEPLYAISYTKHVLEGEHLREVHPFFLQMCEQMGVLSQDLIDEVSRLHSIQSIERLPEEIRKLFVTAHDVFPMDQVRIQAAFQEHVDNAVSKTINLPKESTPGQVRKIFMMANQLGCKGITVYREGSKPGQVLTVDDVTRCPVCGNIIVAEEGAFSCRLCGYSR